jgi:GTPase SAR1 family protein
MSVGSQGPEQPPSATIVQKAGDRAIQIGQVVGDVFFGGASEERRAQRNRRAMLELVKNTWIKGVLEQSLHGAVLIELGMEERKDAVEYPWDMVLQSLDQPNRPLPRGTKILDVFDEMNGSLLILGEPGSGKTTMLLELARDTISRAEEDPAQPIPVVFNLSSWAEKEQSIGDWLVDEFNSKYNIPKKIARPWVENDELTLLLDGLDEVRSKRRDACVQAINGFRQEHLVHLAVCTRTAEYRALATRLKLQTAIVLQPLRPEQIDTYLAGTGNELVAVRDTLEHDTALQELAQSPLTLSVMTLAYRGMPVEDLQPIATIEARRRHIFDNYVQRMFERRSTERRSTLEQTVHWLGWLARRLVQHEQTVFLIERMQPSWLSTSGQYDVCTIGPHVLIGAIFGLLVWVPLGMFAGSIAALLAAILVWQLYIIFAISFSQNRINNINAVETLSLSWSEARRQAPGMLMRGLVYGWILGLLGGLGGWFLYELSGGPLVGLPFGLSEWLLTGLSGWLIVGLLTGLILGLVAGLFSIPIGGLVTKPIEAIMEPNQGIRQSARSALLVGLISGLITGICFGLIAGLKTGLIVGLGVGLAFGLKYGGLDFISHFTLRFILYRDGSVPWNYRHFLDYASERILLRKVGGGYIFIHRSLMEYFAELDQGRSDTLNVSELKAHTQ